MSQEEEVLPHAEASVIQKKTPPFVVVAVCVFLSVFFMKTGLFSLFYLAPLGYAAVVTGSFRLTFCAAAAVNILLFIPRFISSDAGGFVWILMEILYILTLFIGFLWIMGGSRIRTAYRFIIASSAGVLIFLILINSDNSYLYASFKKMAEVVSEAFISSSEADAVKYSVFNDMLTPEKLLETCRWIFMRGGAAVSILFTFFVNRLAVNAAVLIIKKRRKDGDLRSFFAPKGAIWALSGSLAAIILTRIFRVESLEITAWNVFVVCAIIFLAQGAGILIHLLSRKPFSFRLLVLVLIVVLIISPLSAIVLAGLLLLGIVENWLPLREPKQEKTSTPGL